MQHDNDEFWKPDAQPLKEQHSESYTPADPQPDDETLQYYEAIIESARLKREEEVLALLEIHDRGLYKPEYGSFEKYLWKRWQMKRSRGYQLLHWARLKKTPTEGQPSDPQNERQARRLDAQGQVRGQRAKDWTTLAMAYVGKAWEGLAPGEHREFLYYMRSLLDEMEQLLGPVANADHGVVDSVQTSDSQSRS